MHSFTLLAFVGFFQSFSFTGAQDTATNPMVCNLPNCPVLTCANSYTPPHPANECPGCPICCPVLFCPATGTCPYGSTVDTQDNGCPGCPTCNPKPVCHLPMGPALDCVNSYIPPHAANECPGCPVCCPLLFCREIGTCEYGSTSVKQANGCPGCAVCNKGPVKNNKCKKYNSVN